MIFSTVFFFPLQAVPSWSSCKSRVSECGILQEARCFYEFGQSDGFESKCETPKGIQMIRTVILPRISEDL